MLEQAYLDLAAYVLKMVITKMTGPELAPTVHLAIKCALI